MHKMNMKIAMLTPGYPPTTGGIESVVGGLAPALVERGVEVEIWTHDRTITTPVTYTSGGVVVRAFPTTKSHRFPYSRTLWQHAKRFAPQMDVLHAHSYHASVALAALRSRNSVGLLSALSRRRAHLPGESRTRTVRPIRTSTLRSRVSCRLCLDVGSRAGSLAFSECDATAKRHLQCRGCSRDPPCIAIRRCLANIAFPRTS